MPKMWYHSCEKNNRWQEQRILSGMSEMMTSSEIYKILLDHYGPPRWWSDDPYTVIVQAVLVQNTAWKNVEKTTAQMQEKLSPDFIASVPIDELEALIRSCGFYKAKARTIKTLTEWYIRKEEIIRQYSDEALRQEILSIKGIGEESADVILVYAFHRPVFIIDAYTRRLLERLGYSFSSDKERKKFLGNELPQDAMIYGYFHWFILDHSIRHCRKKPICEECPFLHCCRKGREMQSEF